MHVYYMSFIDSHSMLCLDVLFLPAAQLYSFKFLQQTRTMQTWRVDFVWLQYDSSMSIHQVPAMLTSMEEWQLQLLQDAFKIISIHVNMLQQMAGKNMCVCVHAKDCRITNYLSRMSKEVKYFPGDLALSYYHVYARLAQLKILSNLEYYISCMLDLIISLALKRPILS